MNKQEEFKELLSSALSGNYEKVKIPTAKNRLAFL